jgi:hypothetical protein
VLAPATALPVGFQQPLISLVRLLMTALLAPLESTEPPEKQPVLAPATALPVGFQQPLISLVRLLMTALLAPLESTSTWLEATKLMTA